MRLCFVQLYVTGVCDSPRCVRLRVRTAPLVRYIEHGIIHIVRVSPNQKFKGLLHGQPIILESRKDPYVWVPALGVRVRGHGRG